MNIFLEANFLFILQAKTIYEDSLSSRNHYTIPTRIYTQTKTFLAVDSSKHLNTPDGYCNM